MATVTREGATDDPHVIALLSALRYAAAGITAEVEQRVGRFA